MLVVINPDQGVSRASPLTHERQVESVAPSQPTRAVNNTTKASMSAVQPFTGYDQSSEDRPQRQRATLAHQIMNKSVLTLRRDNTVQEAKELLASRPIQHIPITDESRRLVGMMSDRDFLKLPDGAETRQLGEMMRISCLRRWRTPAFEKLLARWSTDKSIAYRFSTKTTNFWVSSRPQTC